MTARATPSPGPGFAEFVTLIALIISLVALSIDAMLPALPEIAADLDVVRINDSQYVISVFFAGMGLGQLFFGPLSDSIGRRPAILSDSCRDWAPRARASSRSPWYVTSTGGARWRA
jgi:MFS family permease